MKSCKLRSMTEAEMGNKELLVLSSPVNFYYIETKTQAKEAVEEILPLIQDNNQLMAVDVETTGFDPYINDIILLQIGLAGNIQYIFDLRRIDPKVLEPVLKSPCWKVGHNIKFDAKFIKQKLDITMSRMFDTYLAENIIRGGEYSSGEGYGLDQVLKRRLGKELKLVSNSNEVSFGGQQADAGIKTERVKKQLQKSFIEVKDGELSDAQLAYAAQDVSSETIFALAQWQTQELKRTGPNTLYDQGVAQASDPQIIEEYEAVFPRNKSLWDTAKLEFKFLEVLVDMELAGMGFSKATHDQVLKNIEEDYESYRKEFLALLAKKTPQKTLFGTAGINPDSNAQVLEELNRLKLNLPDTNSKNLEVKLRELDKNSLEGRILECLLNYRATSKLVSSFGSKLAAHVHPVTGRIHPSVRQILDTGRISMSDPNCQQIPSKIDWKKTGDPVQDKVIDARDGLRECFQAKPGYRYVIFDYSAQELRVTASIALEDKMLKAFIEDKDLHCFSATLMYGEDYDSFFARYKNNDKDAKEKRTNAKVVSFGTLYGSGPSSLSKNLNVDFDTAKDIIDRFWAAYPSLKASMTRYGNLAVKHGYSNTVLGRRRYYTDILEKIAWVHSANSPDVIHKKIVDANMKWFLEKHGNVNYDNMQFAKKALINKFTGEIGRQAGNHHIQGTSADMTKLAAVYIRDEFIKKGLDAKVVALVHDEIIVEAEMSIVDESYKIVENYMKKALNLFCPNVPAEVEGHISTCWKK